MHRQGSGKFPENPPRGLGKTAEKPGHVPKARRKAKGQRVLVDRTVTSAAWRKEPKVLTPVCYMRKRCHFGSAAKIHEAEFSNSIIQPRMEEYSRAAEYTVQGRL